jgi:DNA-binding NarL/FixJ family response regulator
MSAPRILVLADDLIWSTRLMDQLRATGAEPRHLRTSAGLADALPDAEAVVVDLTARAYDAIAAIRESTAAGRRVLAVGQHDDHDLRRRALAAGAERVYAYRRLFEAGPATLARWLAATPAGR